MTNNKKIIEQQILKEIEETSFSGMYAGDVVKEVIKWQSQLKNLSKEEKEPTKIEQLAVEIYYAQAKEVDISVDDWIERLKNLDLSKEEALQQAEKRFGKMTKEDSTRCFTCKEPFIKIDDHTWKGNCKHIPKDWHFSKGGVKEEKDLREKIIEILTGNYDVINTDHLLGKVLGFAEGIGLPKVADQILALLKTQPKEKPEKKRIIRCPKCEGEIDMDDFNADRNECFHCWGQVFWIEPKEKPEKIKKLTDDDLESSSSVYHVFIGKINEIITHLNSHPKEKDENYWKEEARRFCKNANFWRKKYETQKKENSEKERIILCPKCSNNIYDIFDADKNECPHCGEQVFWREPKENPEKDFEKDDPGDFSEEFQEVQLG